MKRLCFFCGLYLFFLLDLSGQDVGEVKTIQEGNKVKITYDLEGDIQYITYFCEVFISLDGGVTFETNPLTALEGAFGEVTPGNNKVVYWNALNDYAEGLLGQYRFKVVVTVTDNTPNQPPTKVNLKSPANNTDGLSTVTTLEWFATSDPESDPIEYDVYIGEFQDPNTKIATNAQGLLVSTPSLKAGTTYSWKVVARDNQGNSSDSDIWFFATGGSSENQNSGIPWAGITNPENGIVLSQKYHANRFDGKEYRFDGWSNTGEVSFIKLYMNGSFVGNAKDANSGSWYLEEEFDQFGKNDIYIISACNNSGSQSNCALGGIKSNTRSIFYLPDPNADHEATSGLEGKIEVDIYGYSLNGITTYYEIWRSTENKVYGENWKKIQAWSTQSQLTDSDIQPQTDYFYFFRAATNTEGRYDTNFSEGAYGSAK